MYTPREFSCLALIISTALLAPGRVQAQGGPPTALPPLANAATVKAVSQVTGRGQHYKIMQAVKRTINPLGLVNVRTNHYTVVANGLNFQDARGNWIESHPVVQAYAGGIVGSGASYTVILATNLNTSGAVDLQTVDQQRIISNPLGLGYYDPDTGKSVLLAQVKDCGAVVTGNHILYPDAFDGVQASVEYVYDTGHFHQNITLLAPPSAQPADYGMGASTRLEMMSELVQSPAPVVTPHVLASVTGAQGVAMASPAVVDQTLQFGAMKMGLGRAFQAGSTNKLGLTVPKQLVNQNGRNILIESVPWSAASAALPAPQQSASLGTPGRRKAGLSRELPEVQMAKAKTNFKARLAQVTKSSPAKLALNQMPSTLNQPNGFTMDYEMVESCSDYYFYPGTYLVQGQLILDDVTYIANNVVIKYDSFASLTINDTITGPGGPLIAPMVLTSWDDDSVGDLIDGSDGSPQWGYTAAPALDLEYLNYNTTFYGLNFKYCYGGLWVDNSPGRTVNVTAANYTNEAGGNSIGNVLLVHFNSLHVCNDTGMANSNDFSGTNVTIGSYSDCYDANGNGIPDSWEYANFGSLQAGTNDYDLDGVNNYQEWVNGTDPNTIQFYLGFTNMHVNSNTAYGHIQVLKGVPSQMAVLVSSSIITNFSNATWQAYNPTVPIPLGTNDGMYNVYVGLRGRLTTSQQSWEPGIVYRDTVAPLIVLTNPVLNLTSVTNVTSQPIIQVQGYCNEPLGDIRYGIINSAGATTNLMGLVNREEISDVTIQGGTNWFHCPDVPLVPGTNTVTLRFTDAAGNVTSTNLLFKLDYSGDHTPPALTLLWPQNGELVVGSQFTLRGQLDDPTATVKAQIVDPSGHTNKVNGLVELNGLLWVQYLPLAIGTNVVQLTMIDAAGNSATTNINVIGDPLSLTINTPPSGQLVGSTTMTGTIGSSNYTVWVNGMSASLATNNAGGWNWTAANVPIPAGGTAVIQARAIPNSDHGGNGSGGASPPANPSSASGRGDESDTELGAIYFTDTHKLDNEVFEIWSSSSTGFPGGQYTWWEINRWTNQLGWYDGNTAPDGGRGSFGHYFLDFDASSNQTVDCLNNSVVWQPETLYGSALPVLDGAGTISSCLTNGTTNFTAGAPPVIWEFWNEHDVGFSTQPVISQTFLDQLEQVRVTLRTGGKRLPDIKWNLFYFTAWANQEMPPTVARNYWTNQYVPAGDILISGVPMHAITNSDLAELYRALPDAETLEITPKTTVPIYTFWEEPMKIELLTQCVADMPTNKDRTTIAVGEQVTFTFVPAPGAAVSWTATAGTLAVTSGPTNLLTAPTNAVGALTVTATVAGQAIPRNFTVVPSLSP